MDIYDFLLKELKKEHKEGKTQAELARNSHQQTIYKILNGEQKIANTSLKTILEIYPKVKRILEHAFCNASGDLSATVNGNGSAAAVNGNATVSQGPIYDSRMEAAQDAILEDADMCEKCKTLALRHIRKPPQNKQ